MWWTRKHGEAKEHISTQLKRPAGGEDTRRAEIAAIKAMEEDMLNEELGLAVKKRRIGGAVLEKGELDQLLARGESTREGTDVERVQGLGAAPSKRHDHIPRWLLRVRPAGAQDSERARDRRVARGGG